MGNLAWFNLGLGTECELNFFASDLRKAPNSYTIWHKV